ncbi:MULTISPECIES: hypothetical protein [unclassified Beijerinckia]|uniref:hypothetical protein n=1 Tax=unclassified Beijerinckia TaxID=2638183 RepID=UPI00089AD60D|nr:MULTISPECIES: hypothetical protein [unclassified Beijerinckia]MDH7795836.1 hypothetical protein [Beijerinckia sp. GAS462]SEC18466.1 hypothetical protein SAMN05443249_2114 [Beijerinckia sp. 28-YEA-48]
MSTSDTHANDFANDFEAWIAREFATTGEFTAFVILVDLGTSKVTPLCSTYFNVMGDEVSWGDIVVMFAGAGTEWDGAAFFPVTATQGGPLDNPNARVKLRDLEARVDDDRLVLNEGHFFDKWGRRMRIDEVTQ